MALVTKFDRNLFALVFNEEQKILLQNAFCSQWATHSLNEKLRELNEDENKFDRKWFKTQKPHISVTQVGVIVESDKIDVLKSVHFFDNKKQADDKLEKKKAKYPDAEIISVKLFVNVPKSEQRKSA